MEYGPDQSGSLKTFTKLGKQVCQVRRLGTKLNRYRLAHRQRALRQFAKTRHRFCLGQTVAASPACPVSGHRWWRNGTSDRRQLPSSQARCGERKFVKEIFTKEQRLIGRSHQTHGQTDAGNVIRCRRIGHIQKIARLHAQSRIGCQRVFE